VGGFTAEKHRDALLKDCAGKGDAEARAGAFLRLGYYYPDALENPALEFLSRPWYSHRDSHAFVRDTLYKEIDARKRRDLFDARIKELGDSERDGIREVLYSDLGTREATEEGRLNPPEKGFTDEPRRLLTELYGAPKNVKAKDKPVPEFASAWHVARVIESGLVYDRSAKIDRAARDILAKTTDGTTALACAQRLVGRGHDAEIEAYARKIETLRDKSYREDFKALVAKSAWTPLHAAVWRGHEERVAELIREGAKVNAAAKDGRTPLHVAAAAGNAGAVTPLVASGADLGAKDAAGRTPVEIASAAGDAATVRALVGAGSPITDVLVAATAGKTRDVDRFLRADKTAVRATDAFGRTPLHRAACEGHADVAKQLLDAGADADAGDKEGYTPLHVAAALGRVETCRVLLDGKARVDAAPPDSGTQPIHLAALDGRSDVIKLLVRKGAKPDAKDAHGGTPLQYAAGAGHLPVVEWLVDQKVDLDAKNKSGWSARMLAVTGGHKQVAEFLLKKGAKKSPLEDW
jgi:ankyrin repeat protein